MPVRGVEPESCFEGSLDKCSHLCVVLAEKELLGAYLFARCTHLVLWLIWFLLWLARRRAFVRAVHQARERHLLRERSRSRRAALLAIRERVLQRRAAKRERKRWKAWRHARRPLYLVRWQRPRRSLPWAAGSPPVVPKGLRLLGAFVLAMLLHMFGEQASHAAPVLRWNWRAPPVFHCAMVQYGDPVRHVPRPPPEPPPRTVPVYGDPGLSGESPVVHQVTVPGGSTSVRVLPQHARPPDDAQAWAAENIITSLPAGVQHAPPDVSHVRDQEHGWIYANHPAFSAEQMARLKHVMVENKSAFAYSTDMPGYSGVEPPFEIKGPGFAAKRRSVAYNRPLSPAEREVLDKTCEDLLKSGIIELVPTSDYISMPLLPAKKDEHGNWTQRRMAIDYRHISALCDHDNYGLPRAEDLFLRIGHASVFTKLDCRSGFHQIPIADEDRNKTAFWWGNKIARWKRMPFGLRNAPSKFQRIMDSEIAARGLSHCCMAFIDDILVFSSNPEEHIEHVRAVLQMLKDISMLAHPMKTLVGADRVEYLGHYVSQYGMTPLDAKIAAIKGLPIPTNVDTLRSALGVVGYYRCYVPNFSVIAAPLTGLFKKGVAWNWGEEQQAAWDELVNTICYGNKAIRRADPTRPYILHTDWSGTGIGAILGQIDDDGNEYMVACASRTCNVHERRYAPFYGEMLAAVWGVKTFRIYLHGAPKFKLVTDHQPLTYLMTNPKLTGQHARWALALQEYDFEIVHRPGVTHQNADGLSRMPLPNTSDGTGACLDPEPYTPGLCLALWSTAGAPSVADQHAHLHACTLRAVMAAGPDTPLDSTAPSQEDLLAGNLGLATDECEHDPQGAESHTAAVLTAQWGEGSAHGATDARNGLRSEPSIGQVTLNVCLARAATAEDAGQSSPDVWGDRETLHLVQTGQHLPGSALQERKRAAKRARSYVWSDGHLFRRFWDGSRREVPPPAARPPLIKTFHEKTGHFGARRTAHLLRNHYWWAGLDLDVRTEVRGCQLCGRVNASFTAGTDTLNPLPLEGMFYRWGVDLAGPLPVTRRANKYVMICVDHWSKVVELIPIPDKSAACTAFAFKVAVLARYGSCAECLTDGGQEWRGEFEALLEQCFIDHRVTSPAHPQTNGCAERCVQTVKRALRKHCESAGSTDTWDEHLPWIQLAYNCSVQASTKLSPYLMLYAHLPVVPPAIVQRMAEPVDYNDTEAAQQSLRARAQLMEQCAVIAGNNLRIAQHRDTLRYAMTHSGAYKPRLRKFCVGDFVYLRVGQTRNTLEVPAQQVVLRIVELRGSGTAVVQGRCGARMPVHVASLAPCHLPDIDPTLDLSLLRPSADFACEVCNSPEMADTMLLCDGCNTGWHMQCLDPPLKSVPKGDWLCPTCVKLGVTPAPRPSTVPEPEVRRKRLFLSKAQRDTAERAAQLDGSTVIRAMRTGRGRSMRLTNVKGTLRYLGPEHRPYYFTVEYENGVTEPMTLATARRSLCSAVDS